MAKRETVDYYDKYTPAYMENWGYNFHFGIYKAFMDPLNREAMLQRMNDYVFDRLQLPQNARVLDLGCGIGESARRLTTIRRDVKVCGLTISPIQVEIGRKLTRQAGLAERVSLIHADYTLIPHGILKEMDMLPVQGVYTIESSCYDPDPNKSGIIREAYNAIEKGGVVFADGFKKHSNPLHPWIERGYQTWGDGWAVPNLADINRFCAQLTQQDFTDIKVTDVSWNVAPSVLHAVFMAAKYTISNIIRNDRHALDYGKEDLISAVLTCVLGASRKDFGYYIVSASKN